MPKKDKPLVAVFFGGTVPNHDLSYETGQNICQHIPRSHYTVIPIHVTSDGRWQVPLGTLPQHGSVARVIEMLLEAVPAVTPQHGLERLFTHPVAAFFTLLRGPGGDDGSLHALAHTINVRAVGGAAACAATTHKHTMNKLVADIVGTPYTHHYRHGVPNDEIIDTARHEFIPPFFVKPANQEGSSGVEEIHSHDELASALKGSKNTSDVLLQQPAPGQELVVSLFEDRAGDVHTLPPTVIHPRKTSFYNYLAKRYPGQVALDTGSGAGDQYIKPAVEIAHHLFERLDCHGLVSMDMTIGPQGVHLLDINTIPTFTAHTPLFEQLRQAKLHPSSVLDEVLQQTLGMNA